MLLGCGGKIAPLPPSEELPDAGARACPETAGAPETLACTGLYARFATKELADNVRAYAPANAFWSDGAEKQRFIALPEDGVIDARGAGEWIFPVGTKAWKEFRVGAARVETRYFEKKRPAYWVSATYVWSADESSAVSSSGAEIGAHHVPTPAECDQCHKGSKDRLLGFEPVGLALPGAAGLTLSVLAAEHKIRPLPGATELSIRDDGTGLAAPALAWLHVNCGLACHNATSGSLGYGIGMHLRLEPIDLGGEIIATTVNMPARTPRWTGELRIAPGLPEASLLVRLAATRSVDGNDQMPPIATRVVDEIGLATVIAWIRAMPRSH